MFERFTDEARTVVVHAQQHARRLGHRYIGTEHILLAVAGGDGPAGAALRECGLSPERVEEEIVGRVGLGAGAGLFGDLDRDALASIGVDLDAVRARIEANFGTEALIRAGQLAQGMSRPRRRRRRLRGRLRGRRNRMRMWAGVGPGLMAPPATGRYQAPGARPAGHIPFTPRAKKVLELAFRESVAVQDPSIGAEHIALAVTSTGAGLVPAILAALDAPPRKLRAAIEDRRRKAS